MKGQRAVPRRRKASAAARLRPFWIVILVLAILAAVGATAVVLWPGFEPKQIDVSGNKMVPRSEIVDRAGISPRINMWLQNTKAIAQRVEAIPYVEVARVHRIPPATVTIAITERVPFALLRSGKDAAVVDKDLRVLAPSGGDSAVPVFQVKPGLTLDPGAFLNEPSAIAMRDDYNAMIAAHVVPLALSFDKFGGLVADVRGGIRILLGDDDDLSKKLALVDPILSQVVRKGRPVSAIDLRAPGTPVVVYK